MRRSRSWMLIVGLALAGAQAIAAEQAWTFDSEDPSWTAYNGVWELRDGVYSETSGEEPAAHALVDGEDWTDYTLEARVRVDEGGHAGIAFRAQSKVDYYVYYVNITDGRSELWRMRAGHPRFKDDPEKGMYKQRFPIMTGIELKNATLKTGEWFDMKVVVDGDLFRLYVDDQLQAEASDTTKFDPYTYGGVGVWTWETKASFDDLRVYGDAVPPQTTVVE